MLTSLLKRFADKELVRRIERLEADKPSLLRRWRGFLERLACRFANDELLGQYRQMKQRCQDQSTLLDHQESEIRELKRQLHKEVVETHRHWRGQEVHR